MLKFSRMQVTAILVTVLVICGFAVPNFLSDETTTGWPDWTQRRITLAPELQGGTSLLLEVDRNAVREHVAASLFRDVRGILHDARIGLASPAAIRNGSVEVRPLAGNFEAAFTKLGALSQAFNGIRAVEVTDAGGGLIRLTPTDAGVREYEPPIVGRWIETIRARLFGLPVTVEREGTNRLRVQAPGVEAEAFARMRQ